MWHDYEISQKTMQQKESRGWAKYEKRKISIMDSSS